LRSVPARFGSKRAMRLAALAHLVTVVCLVGVGRVLHRGPVFLCGVAIVAAILWFEHRLVRGSGGAPDLAQIPKAFFDCNAYVSVAFFAATAIDAAL
jgi:4-hydroxybenzoate polyprenyltransferase